MNLATKYLSILVLLAIGAGLGLDHLFPELSGAVAQMEVAKVNLPIALLIWVMVLPMFAQIDLSSLKNISKFVSASSITLFVNWIVKPLSMAFFGWLFLKVLFINMLDYEQIDSYIAGLIILAAAPCTAMVFIWSRLCKGDSAFTLAQVALNDLIMVIAFVPICQTLIGLTSLYLPWETLLVSLALYLVLPFALASLAPKISERLEPLTLPALLLTITLIFCFQGRRLLSHPETILLLSIPITLQVFFTFTVTVLLTRRFNIQYSLAAPAALIGASNFFELAVATAISLFGLHSGATLATVVGVLIEVPLMLLLVRILKNRFMPIDEYSTEGIGCD